MEIVALLESILDELDIAVFRAHQINGHPPTFSLINQAPAWIKAFYPDNQNSSSESPSDKPVNLLVLPNSRLNLTATFPFLESFLADAEAIWSQQDRERATSGIWTEVTPSGHQHQLEAMALLRGDVPLLIILNLTRTFDERHHIYQRAREIALANEKLIVQLNHRQRELQEMLERQMTDHQGMNEISDSVRNNASAVLICKPDGGVEVMNQALVDIYRVASNKTDSQSLLDKWLREAEDFYPEIHRVVAAGSYWEGEFESLDEAGDRKWIRLAIGPVLDDQGQLTHYICIANDISLMKKSGEEITKITDYDFTTHLPNRRHFWRHLTKAIDQGIARRTTLALIYIDLDDFKKINDTLGHHAGDFLLSTLGTRLARCIKRGDFIAHLGGDEFAILLELPHASVNIDKVAQRVQAAIRKTVAIESSTLQVTASIGIALHPKDGRDATSLMKHADLAMFHAKKLGKGNYQTFTSNLNTEFLHLIQLEKDLRIAIDQRQFGLVYQPQVCSGEDHYLRLEALIRWEHPQKGNISPGRFIPISEENGMILEIGVWVLETACKQAMELLNEGFNIIIAVNVSAKQVKQSNFKALIESVLKSTGLPAKHLELEITETTVMEEMEHVIGLLHELRQLGISISLDDFGSGFSSLSYLKNLPVDYLKLDRSFIHELPGNEESQAITTSVINLAHQLKMKVIAEGVENNDQLRFLRDKGCDYMQGYLFYYPLEAHKIREIFTSIRGVASH